jgi:hypothetical protein
MQNADNRDAPAERGQFCKRKQMNVAAKDGVRPPDRSPSNLARVTGKPAGSSCHHLGLGGQPNRLAAYDARHQFHVRNSGQLATGVDQVAAVCGYAAKPSMSLGYESQNSHDRLLAVSTVLRKWRNVPSSGSRASLTPTRPDGVVRSHFPQHALPTAEYGSPLAAVVSLRHRLAAIAQSGW